MSTSMHDPLLTCLDDDVLTFIEAQLSTNAMFDNGELHALFVSMGLTELQATRALQYRNLYLHHIYLTAHTPIRSNKHALRLNPQRRQFELITY